MAASTGILLLKMPYSSHSNTPTVKTEYIESEMLEVSRVRITRMAWGRKENVVQAAAT